MPTWSGDPPTQCQLCQEPITTSFVDGRMRQGGSWAYMCPECHAQHGVGLGAGKGQRYDKLTVKDVTVWTKVAG